MQIVLKKKPQVAWTSDEVKVSLTLWVEQQEESTGGANTYIHS